MKLQEKILDIKNQIDKIKLDLQQLILQLPDNPQISRLGNCSAFTINFSTVSKSMNLSPFYHDFKSQYQAINNEIDKCEPLRVYDKLNTIVTTGKIVYTGKGLHGSRTGTDTLHPDVIKSLKLIIENNFQI